MEPTRVGSDTVYCDNRLRNGGAGYETSILVKDNTQPVSIQQLNSPVGTL